MFCAGRENTVNFISGHGSALTAKHTVRNGVFHQRLPFWTEFDGRDMNAAVRMAVVKTHQIGVLHDKVRQSTDLRLIERIRDAGLPSVLHHINRVHRPVVGESPVRIQCALRPGFFQIVDIAADKALCKDGVSRLFLCGNFALFGDLQPEDFPPLSGGANAVQTDQFRTLLCPGLHQLLHFII